MKVISHGLTTPGTLVCYSVMKDTGVVTSDITFNGRNIVEGWINVVRGILLLWRFQFFAMIIDIWHQSGWIICRGHLLVTSTWRRSCPSMTLRSCFRRIATSLNFLWRRFLTRREIKVGWLLIGLLFRIHSQTCFHLCYLFSLKI